MTDTTDRNTSTFPKIKVLVVPALFFLFTTSLLPLLAKFGDLNKNPIRKLKWKASLNLFDHRWNFYLAEGYRAAGDFKNAELYIKKAISEDPFDPLPWLSLSELFRERGEKDKSIECLEKVATLYPTSASLRWYIFVHSISLGTTKGLKLAEAQVPWILKLSPSKRYKIFNIIDSLEGKDRLSLMIPEDRSVVRSYLLWLIRKGYTEDSVKVWEKVKKNGWDDPALFRSVVQGLIWKKDFKNAFMIWKEKTHQKDVVFNGGFERDIENFGFGWRFPKKLRGLRRWGYSTAFKTEGRRSFFMEFNGEENPSVRYPSQLVFIEEPGKYRLSALVKTEEVTSAEGFRLAVWGSGIKGKVTRDIKGYTFWKILTLDFEVPNPGPVWIAIVRRKTTKLNRFLGGRIWIDEVKIEREETHQGHS